MKTWGAIFLVSFRRWLQCEVLDEQKLDAVAVCVELVWATWNSPMLLRDFCIFVDICLCIYFVTVYAVELILFLLIFVFFPSRHFQSTESSPYFTR